MVVTYVPNSANGGLVKNFQPVGEVAVFDSIKCTYIQGTWVNNKLNGATSFTNFFSPIVNIKLGPYTSNQPNGTIEEYTFDKTLWADFITNPPAGIAATKKINVYTAGALTSTTSTETVNITGLTGTNLAGNVISFIFNEVTA